MENHLHPHFIDQAWTHKNEGDMTDISQHISGQIWPLRTSLFKDNGDGTAFRVKQKRMDFTAPGRQYLLYAL